MNGDFRTSCRHSGYRKGAFAGRIVRAARLEVSAYSQDMIGEQAHMRAAWADRRTARGWTSMESLSSYS